MKRFAVGVFAAALAFWVYAVPWLIGRLVPPEHFITIETFFIHDAVEGQPVYIEISRTNHRDYEATYHPVVRRDSPLGPIVCEDSYLVPSTAGSPPPVGMTLARWLGYTPCDLPPGRYVSITPVRIPAWLGATVDLTVTSNLFTIHAEVPGE